LAAEYEKINDEIRDITALITGISKEDIMWLTLDLVLSATFVFGTLTATRVTIKLIYGIATLLSVGAALMDGTIIWRKWRGTINVDNTEMEKLYHILIAKKQELDRRNAPDQIEIRNQLTALQQDITALQQDNKMLQSTLEKIHQLILLKFAKNHPDKECCPDMVPEMDVELRQPIRLV